MKTQVRTETRPATAEDTLSVSHSPAGMHEWILRVGRQITADRPVAVFAVLLPLLLYSVELANFTLSTDEEVPERGRPDDWIRQGRWGMGLLTWIMPPIQELPIIATVIFCLCLSLTGLLIAALVARGRFESVVVIGFFVASPVWPHLAEFNTLSWGLGIALVAVALCAHTLKESSYPVWLLGALLLAFGISVYQSTVFLLAPVALVVCLPNRVFLLGSEAAPPEVGRTLARLAGTAIGGVAIYVLVMRFSLALTQQSLEYVAGYNKLDLLFDPTTRTETARAVARMLFRLWTGLTGGFLGQGAPYLVLPGLGLLVPAVRFCSSRTTHRDRFSGVVVLTGTLGCTAFPILLAGGEVPLRVLLGFPVSCALAALAAARLLHRFRWAVITVAAVGLLTSWWITTALFTADQVARDRDAAMATQIMTRMQALGVGSIAGPEPFVAAGYWVPERAGVARATEFFGASYFGVEEGDSGRIASYLWLKGQSGLVAVPDSRLAFFAGRVHRMPSWPAAGSVARIDGVVVLKLGNQVFPSPAQP